MIQCYWIYFDLLLQPRYYIQYWNHSWMYLSQEGSSISQEHIPISFPAVNFLLLIRMRLDVIINNDSFRMISVFGISIASIFIILHYCLSLNFFLCFRQKSRETWANVVQSVCHSWSAIIITSGIDIIPLIRARTHVRWSFAVFASDNVRRERGKRSENCVKNRIRSAHSVGPERGRVAQGSSECLSIEEKSRRVWECQECRNKGNAKRFRAYHSWSRESKMSRAERPCQMDNRSKHFRFQFLARDAPSTFSQLVEKKEFVNEWNHRWK